MESREALRSRLPLSDSNSNGTPYRRIAVYLRNLAASRLPKRFKRASTYDEVQDRCRDAGPAHHVRRPLLARLHARDLSLVRPMIQTNLPLDVEARLTGLGSPRGLAFLDPFL